MVGVGGQRTRRRRRESTRITRLLLAFALAALVAGEPGCGAPPPPEGVVLVVVDTLRADHLSTGGYERGTSPSLAALAREGTTFRRCYAHSSSTRPSVATILTSRFVSAHGVVTQGADGLARDVPYLPEILQGHGFRTLAFVTNPQLHPRLGFARGFDSFDAMFQRGVDPTDLNAFDLVSGRADAVVARVRAAIEALPPGQPFFAYVHLLDPHGPYEPPPGFRERFIDPAYRGPVTGSLFDFKAYDLFRSDPRQLAQFVGLYDGEIAATDAAIGTLVDWLRSSGRLARTLIVITADHGEEFLEHGDLGHGLTLYEEVVRVPLVLAGPGVPRARASDALVGLIDVTPSILALVGLAAPDGALQGRSLRGAWPLLGGDRRTALLLEGPGVGAVARDGRLVPRVTRAVVTGERKIVSTENVRGEPAWNALEVFDLRADPSEQKGRAIRAGAPLDAADRALVAAYEGEVARALATPGPADPPSAALPPEDLERLRGLGYVTP